MSGRPERIRTLSYTPPEDQWGLDQEGLYETETHVAMSCRLVDALISSGDWANVR